ncbi:MAG: hypothetical protein ACRDPY_30515 [Streptosporangiaceae bacterium]
MPDPMMCSCGLAAGTLRFLDDHLVRYPGHHERDSGRNGADVEAEWLVPVPPHHIGALATFELFAYRRALSSGMQGGCVPDGVKVRLRRRLDVVIAEQRRRAEAARVSRADEAERQERRAALYA